jgi:hypothetical protein
MGMYTELILGCRFKKDTPDNLIYTIAVLTGRENILLSLTSIKGKEYKMLWEKTRNPLNGDSYSFFPRPSCMFWLDNITSQYYIQCRSSIKNYDNEIEKFLELIKPYIDRGVGELNIYAYVLYEENQYPTFYSLDKEDE